ncbi:DUF2239 family protein [Polyangium aurulentum]|uniref:DUF2239 family protein n=1 Tax=Polyangium aurulentum TaxID=2567896 RepID=UPI0010ADF00B|nr:DUF2239 family protein [Polyangium aurulentum]UQA56729.1 DUF2239 family protein [Polyangium aurulentum]
MDNDDRTYTAFVGTRLLVSGSLRSVVPRTKEHLDRGEAQPLLIFDDQTGQQVELDLRGTVEEVLARHAPTPPRTGPGRPKLGVVSREVSLLPRHWEWLEQQPSGASAALRRLVEEASKKSPGKERARLMRDATYKIMSAMAGNLPGFEEASRALFAKDHPRFEALIRDWPEDIRNHLAQKVEQCARLEEE